MRTVYLAWRYVCYNKLKSAILIACITLTLFVPTALAILLEHFQRQLVTRADSTPLVIGAAGSRLDLTLHAMHFRIAPPANLRFRHSSEVSRSQLAEAIPLYSRFTARGWPIVGTTLEYFEFRGLQIADGEGLIRLGDCVVGSNVARQLGTRPGDRLLSDRDNILDIAGAYPLRMRVTGVLERTWSPDDDAVFVDLKTAWVIEGLGHGHDDVSEIEDDSLVLGREGAVTIASPAVLPFTEVTDENVHTFHFHGSPSEFPISAVIAVPHDERSATILIGRYDGGGTAQIVVPGDEVRGLMSMLFRVKRFFDANAALIGFSTVLLLVLVTVLSIKLRHGEMVTMFKIGCARGTITSLIAWELVIIFASALTLVAALTLVTWYQAGAVIRVLLAMP